MIQESLRLLESIRKIQNTPLDRRDFLKIAVGPVVLALTACNNAAQSEKIRRTEGEWNKKDIESLAQEMIKETQFRDIPYAGYVLLGNLEGRNTVSQMSPLFVDEPIKVITAPNEAIASPYPNVEAAYAALIDAVGPKENFVFKGKNGNDISADLERRVQLQEIRIGKKITQKHSDFLFKLTIAKEIYNIKGFDEVSYNVLALSEGDVVLPTDEEAFRTLRIKSMRGGKYRGIPMNAIGDIWAHFYMVPDYTLGREMGKLTRADIEDTDNIFGGASRFFKDQGILVKKNGRYEWQGTREKIFDVFMQATSMIYKTFLESKTRRVI